MINLIAVRYATALFEMATDVQETQVHLKQLKVIEKIIENNPDVKEFFVSPVAKADAKEKVLTKAILGKGLSEDVEKFIFVLVKKNRFYLFLDIVKQYRIMCDDANLVIRGEVRSAQVLKDSEREDIQETISRVTKKKVILNFIEDSKVIGGLVATVGSRVFDDTLFSHLNQLKEGLNRR